jgi:predicted pyridoxine 5'-phosphate oxidase superfamily flavin-nucleotide-binding protein
LIEEVEMAYGFMDIAITPSVRAARAEMGADHIWTDFTGDRDFDRFTDLEVAFIGQRDTLYIASVSETGWPYVQHRGGPPGFLKVIDDRTLAFADYLGNRQYISTGNLGANNRVSLILMDYPRRWMRMPRCSRGSWTQTTAQDPKGLSGCGWRRSTGTARSTSPRALRNARSPRAFLERENAGLREQLSRQIASDQ